MTDTLKALDEIEAALKRANMELNVPAAEYVPAIPATWDHIVTAQKSLATLRAALTPAAREGKKSSITVERELRDINERRLAKAFGKGESAPEVPTALTPVTDDVAEIQARHDLADNGDMEGEDWDTYIAFEDAHTDRATLLRLLSEERARADKADALMDARYDLAYANGFRAGWNAGVTYEQCQAVQSERKASGNPEECLQTLAAMDRRSADALAVIVRATHKDTQDE